MYVCKFFLRMSSDYHRIANAIEWLQKRTREQPQLEGLARELGLSRSYTQRLFKRWAGLSLKDFHQVLSVNGARAQLAASRSVLEAALDAGLSGPGHLYDQMVTIDAVSPGEAKSGEEGIEIVYGVYPTPFGGALIGQTSHGICHWYFIDTPEVPDEEIDRLRRQWPSARLTRDDQVVAKSVAPVFTQSDPAHVPLHVRGTNFRVKVWQAMLCIPRGHLISYEDMATLLGRPKGARAIANAVAANHIGYLIPCHRVLRNTGALGGYRWHPTRKLALRAWEAGHPLVARNIGLSGESEDV